MSSPGAPNSILICVYNHRVVLEPHFKSPMDKGVSRFGPAVKRHAGKQKGLGSIPLWLSFLFKKVVDNVL